MSNPVLVNTATLDELGDVVGKEKLARLIDRFVTTLATSFEGEGREAADLGREAHTLVSMSGMLGCDALFKACRTVEYAAKGGEDLAIPLAEARVTRDDTIAALKATRPAV